MNKLSIVSNETKEITLGIKKSFPGNIYLFKVGNRNTRKRCQICSKTTINTLEQRY